MMLTKDYIAHIRVFYTPVEFYNDKHKVIKQYLVRHGWDVHAGGNVGDSYKEISVGGYVSAKKNFHSSKQMEDELADIESAFHDANIIDKDGYFSSVGPATFFDGSQYRLR